MAIETGWDIFNVTLDAASLGANIATGNWSGAAVDGVALLLDVAATTVPGVPGGAGAALKVAREADQVIDVAKAGEKAVEVAKDAEKATDFAQASATAHDGAKAAEKSRDSAEKVVTDKWSREPKSLQDEMTLEAAKNIYGKPIITDLKDPKYRGMEKWQYSVKSASGRDSVVHFVVDPKTGQRMDFKFKKHSTD